MANSDSTSQAPAPPRLVGITFPHIHAMMSIEDLKRGSGRDLATDLIRTVELALSPEMPDEGKNLEPEEAQALSTTLRAALTLIDATEALRYSAAEATGGAS